MKKINYKSDFDLLATMKCYDTSGKEIEIGFADYDWELDLYTGCGNYAPKMYKVSYIGGKATNCFNDDGKVHIVCDNHNLNLGVLNGTIKAKIPNAIYPDGTQLIVSPLTFAIELVADGGDTPSPIEVEIMLPYLYDSIYRIAQQSGYDGTQEEYYQLVSQLPNAVETANKVQESADSLADSAEQIGGAIETLGATTDAIEQGANVIKNNADTLQASATIVKTSAEQIGGSIADLKASVSSIDGAVDGINQGASTIANSATKVETSATTLEGVSATISGSATSLADSATAIAEGANTIKSSADTLQTNADKVSESATKVEQSVEPLVQASESLDATKQAFEMLSSEWSDGRRAIATALTNRRYPTDTSESFHAMADKITNMSYEEGWFAKIGYSDENDGGIKDAIEYSYELAKGWNPDGSTAQMFRGNTELVFLPSIDVSRIVSGGEMFYNCTSLVFIPQLDTRAMTSIGNICYNCTKLKVANFNFDNVVSTGSAFNGCNSLLKVPPLPSSKITNFTNLFNGCNRLTRIPLLDFTSATTINGMVNNCSSLLFLLIRNLGKSYLSTYNFSGASNWGTGSAENRQSLIDSLITYSYDRASNGMATATIQLHANTKALLTEEEIAQITAKGFTIA